VPQQIERLACSNRFGLANHYLIQKQNEDSRDGGHGQPAHCSDIIDKCGNKKMIRNVDRRRSTARQQTNKMQQTPSKQQVWSCGTLDVAGAERSH
jgi:hypothetical protein